MSRADLPGSSTLRMFDAASPASQPVNSMGPPTPPAAPQVRGVEIHRPPQQVSAAPPAARPWQPPGNAVEDPRLLGAVPTPPVDVGIEIRSTVAPEGAPVDPSRHPAYEVHTKHHVYLLDARLECVQVQDARTGATRDHTVLGAKLVGGHVVDQFGRERAVFPLPPPGSEAMFERRDVNGSLSLLRTSKVVHMVVNLLTVELGHRGR